MALYIPDPRFEMPELLEPGKKPTGPVVINTEHALAPDSFILGSKRLGFGPLEQGSSSAITNAQRYIESYYTGTSETEIADSGFTIPTVGTDNSFPYNSALSNGACWVFHGRWTTGGTAPAILYEEGGDYNGVEFIYRTTPNKLSVVVAVGATETEDQLDFDFGAAGLEDNDSVFAIDFDGTTWRLFVNGEEKASITGTHGTPSFGTSGPSIFGVDNGNYGAGSAEAPTYKTGASGLIVFPWSGRLYSVGRYARSMAKFAGDLTRDPYQFLIPA